MLQFRAFKNAESLKLQMQTQKILRKKMQIFNNGLIDVENEEEDVSYDEDDLSHIKQQKLFEKNVYKLFRKKNVSQATQFINLYKEQWFTQQVFNAQIYPSLLKSIDFSQPLRYEIIAGIVDAKMKPLIKTQKTTASPSTSTPQQTPVAPSTPKKMKIPEDKCSQCGEFYPKGTKRQHNKTPFHMDYIQNVQAKKQQRKNKIQNNLFENLI